MFLPPDMCNKSAVPESVSIFRAESVGEETTFSSPVKGLSL